MSVFKKIIDLRNSEKQKIAETVRSEKLARESNQAKFSAAFAQAVEYLIKPILKKMLMMLPAMDSTRIVHF